MPNKYTISVDITGKDNLTTKLAGIHKSLNNFGADIRSALSPSIAGFNVDLVRLGKELLDLGMQAERASFYLTKFAGSEERAKELTDAFTKGADYQITSLVAMDAAAEMVRKGMFTTAEDMEMVARMATDLGDSASSAEANIASFTRMLNLGSTRGLNQFGMNAEKVEKRIRELVKAGMSQKEAFRTSVFEEGAKQLALLGDNSVLLGEKMDTLKTAVQEAKIGFGSMLVEWLNAPKGILTLGLGIEEFTKRLRELPKTFQQLVTVLVYGYTYWDTFVRTLGNAKLALWEAKGAAADYINSSEALAPAVQEVSEKTTKFTYITNDEVKARLEANRAAQESINLTVEQVKAVGALSESLKDATQAQIASAAIKNLTAAMDANVISATEAKKAADDLRLATGLATPESIEMATALETNSAALIAGTMAFPDWIAATNELVSSGKAATTMLSAEATAAQELTLATGQMGESLKDATKAQIATAAMEGLTAAYKAGKVAEEVYVRESNALRVAVGLATPESIKMAEAIRQNSKELADGTINVSWWRKEIDALIATSAEAMQATIDFAVATGQLSESLMDATAAQAASEAIRGLTAAFEAGMISQEQYTEASNGLRVSFGLATPESIRLAMALQENNRALADGVIGMAEWRSAAEGLISAAGAAYEAQERQKQQEEEARRAAEEHQRAMERERQATIDLTVSTGQLSESLKNATAAQIASAAIEGLTAAYKAGKISQAEYIKAANDLRVAAGLATPESIQLAAAIELANKQLQDGVITMEQWKRAMDALIAKRNEGWEKPAPIRIRGSQEIAQTPGGAPLANIGTPPQPTSGAGATSNYYFNQTVNTRAPVSTVVQDFQALRGLVA